MVLCLCKTNFFNWSCFFLFPSLSVVPLKFSMVIFNGILPFSLACQTLKFFMNLHFFSWAWPDLLVWEFPPCFVLLLFLDISGSDKFSSGCNCLSLIQCPNMKFNCHLMTRVHFSPCQGLFSFIPLLEIFQRSNCFTLFPGYFSHLIAVLLSY